MGIKRSKRDRKKFGKQDHKAGQTNRTESKIEAQENEVDMELHEVLEKVKSGTISIEEAEAYFKREPFEDLGFAKIDTHRTLRQGFPEVIFCEGKADDHLAAIFQRILAENGEVLGTRASQEQYALLSRLDARTVYDPISRIIKVEKEEKEHTGAVAVCSAGTADIPVAEEAAATAEFFGCRVTRLYDVGVAGVHRLLAHVKTLQEANCVIAVAGMEGALASVVGGLVERPVIAVPTSVGYGANLKGLSALLTMINSCANGVAVVNIDNGYGAGYLATQMNRMCLGGMKREGCEP